MHKYAIDFETNQNINDCHVWVWGAIKIGEKDMIWGTNLDSFFDFFLSKSCVAYTHNLQFDSEPLIYWLFEHGFKHTFDKLGDMQFNVVVDQFRRHYSLTVRYKGNIFTIYDSLKKIPMTIKLMAKSFGLPIEKGEIDYRKQRDIGYEPTEKELAYLYNDIYILSESLKQFFSRSLNKMTLSSDALKVYIDTLGGREKFRSVFPIENNWDYIKQAYRGGFVYVSDLAKGRDIKKGVHLDVNSLYPSIMRYSNLPYDEGVYYTGKYEQDNKYPLYVQRLMCSFDIKKDHIPTIQVKNDPRFNAREFLKTTNYQDVILTLTNYDLELLFKHYDVDVVKWVDGYKYKSCNGLFDRYVDKYTEEKIQCKKNGDMGGYTIAKRMMNALSGKFGSQIHRMNKEPYIGVDNVLHFRDGKKVICEPVYLPVVTFITAIGRYKVITAAQENYDRFLYSDTDSLFLEGEELPDLEIDKYKLGAWDVESIFDRARFLKAKTYVEDIDGKGLKVKVAGLSSEAQKSVTWENFHINTNPYYIKGHYKKNQKKNNIKDNGVYTRLKGKHVPGGVVLIDEDFIIKP